jgi:hypothetical protein
MALGELTRQLAKQAIGEQVKDMLDSLRPPDLSTISESLRTAKPAPPASLDNLGATLIGQVQAMQKALKDDEELVVVFDAGAETIRVLEIFVPSWQLLVLTGIDTGKNVTRVISPAASTQLVCRAMKVQPPQKPIRIGIIAPRP